jgi:hypothetical protein
MKYPSGNHFEGEWRNDQKNGYGIMIWRDLDEVYTGTWLDDKPHGYGEHIWGDSSAKTIKKQNCNMYRGHYDDGKRHGFGTFFYMNGSQYSGQWKNDVKDGPGIFIHPDGRVIAGNYSNNRLVQAVDEEFANQRVTEDISAQYHLILTSIFDSYPNIEYNPMLPYPERVKNQKKLLQDIERLLLKYNSYLKATYRHYNELNNKQRLKEIPYIPDIESLFQNHPSLSSVVHPEELQRLMKFHKSTILARNITKRLYCLNLEFMIRFLREISLINEYYNCYDVVKVYQTMKEDQLTVSMKQYTEMINLLLAERMQSAKSSPDRPPSSSNENKPNSPTTNNNNNDEDDLDQQSTSDSISSLLYEADLSIGKLLDDYQDIYAYDTSYASQVNQPLLEHEFIELFIRIIGERQVRIGEPLNLYQATEKVLAQNVSLLFIYFLLLLFANVIYFFKDFAFLFQS